MNIPATDLPARVPSTPAATENPETGQCSPTSESAQEGQQAAQEIEQDLELLGDDADTLYYNRGGGEPSVEGLLVHKETIPAVNEALQRAKTDPEFAAAFFKELGPERTASLIANYDALINGDSRTFDSRYQIGNEEGIALIQDFSAALGSASRAGAGCFDGATFMREMVATRLSVGGGEVPFDTELAAIILTNGQFTPEAAAQIGAHVLLNDDPPGVEPVDTYPSHRETLLTPYAGAPADAVGAWPTALRGILANGASSELLAIQAKREDGSVYAPVAERLLDPGLQTSNVQGTAPRVNHDMPLIGAILDQPIHDLKTNPSDAAAMSAIESVMLASKQHHGRVNPEAAQSIGNIYTAFAPEILNAGEGASAFPLARNSALGRFLADSGPLNAGDGSFMVTAALTATDTPPINPDAASPDPTMPGERFSSWQQAVAHATAQYRNEVEAHGPPKKEAPGGGTYPDINALALEVADIDGELLTGTYGAAAIEAANVDSQNALTQQAFNVLTDYAGFAVGLGTGGAARALGATAYNTHTEGAILEHFFPTDNAQRVFSETVPQQQQKLLAAQAVRIVDSAAQSGAITLPDSLRDPKTGGLRAPEAGADADRFAADLASYIRSTPAVREAVDLAQAQLEERTNALDMGQYRGG